MITLPKYRIEGNIGGAKVWRDIKSFKSAGAIWLLGYQRQLPSVTTAVDTKILFSVLELAQSTLIANIYIVKIKHLQIVPAIQHVSSKQWANVNIATNVSMVY